MLIIPQTEDENKQFNEIVELAVVDIEEAQRKLDEISDRISAQIQAFLNENDYILDLGERGKGHVSWNGIRRKTIHVSGMVLSWKMPRLRSRKLVFCQGIIPDAFIPYLNIPVEKVIKVCLEADAPDELLKEQLSVATDPDAVCYIVEKFKNEWDSIMKNFGITLLQSAANLCRECIRLIHRQFFSPRRNSRDIYFSLPNLVLTY